MDCDYYYLWSLFHIICIAYAAFNELTGRRLDCLIAIM